MEAGAGVVVDVKGLPAEHNGAFDDGAGNGERRDGGGGGDGDASSDATSDVETGNWEQLEQELYAARNGDEKRQSRLLNTLTLREEIRRQLAEEDAKKSAGGGAMRKSKSGFLDASSSSESEADDDYNGQPAQEFSGGGDSNTSTSDDDDKQFYLNQEFSTRIGLCKVSPNSTFRTAKDSDSKLNVAVRQRQEQLVVRPLQSRPSLKTRIRNQKDLQICFLNDFPTRTSTPSSGRSSTESNDRLAAGAGSVMSASEGGPSLLSKEFWSPPAEATTSRHVFHSLYMPKSRSMFEMDTEKQRSDRMVMGQFDQAQAKWRHEMQLKIQRSHQQIHLQIQRQRRRHKKSPITTKINLPHGRTRLDRPFLSDMPVSHLQIILNDLLEQIESLNDGLVRSLEERDELHMEQDSKLVDIDDLSRRLKEQWMVNWKRHTMAEKDGKPSSLEESGAFARPYDQRNAFNNRNTFSSHPEDDEETSFPEPTVATTPTSSLRNFRQRIKSLLS
ncbi:hypothetical protein BV898_18126 [Hypsibius exemplaris]|uniref:Schwannomin interacting protein 1 C-terminal domain-containing protein n=1 Tax=Hypsibius exemplaris TaxID=2072580 RepID=A0A9X6RMT4_HYPEX|nr:hypothetical protein BV898_18126 [Hypsibius exemplaris]